MKQDQWFVKPKTGLDISGNGLINLITFVFSVSFSSKFSAVWRNRYYSKSSCSVFGVLIT